jgi:ABC-type sulfate transport system permease component
MCSQQKFNDDVYQTYKFSFSYAGLKNTLISVFSKIMALILLKRDHRIRKRINQLERSTQKYHLQGPITRA